VSILKDQKKILYIHYYFPPVGTIGTIRNYYIAKQLSRQFSQSFLISVKHKPFLLDELFDTNFIERYEVENYDYRWFLSLFTFGEISKARSYKSYQFTRLLIRMADSYPFNQLIGEGGWMYIQKGLKLASKLKREQKITHIYSSFRPTADHLIASKLKKRFPDLVWIADFRDLPVDNNRKNTIFPALQDKYHKQLIQGADYVLTVSEGLKRKLDTYHPNVLLVRSGLHELIKPLDSSESEKFTLSYTGSIYKDHQDLKALLKAIKCLVDEQLIDPVKFELIYAGMDKYWWEKQLEDHGLEMIGNNKELLSLTESIKIQHRSHINILLSWSGPFTTGVLTGKLYEYLAAGKPILCIVNGMKDAEMESLFEQIHAGKVFYTTQSDLIKNWILEYYTKWEQTGQVIFEMNKMALKDFEWERTTRAITEKL